MFNSTLKAAAILTFAFGLTAFQSEAATIYDNGPINGTVDGRTISGSFSVSDSFSFTVPSTTSLSSAQIGIWVEDGTLSSLDWSIGTSAFASNISSGPSGSVTNTFQFTNIWGYDIYESDFAVSGSLVAGTTYWFTLQNAVTTAGSVAYWDQNNGPSSAQSNVDGTIPSESFQLYGSAAATPDTGTTGSLLGLSLMGLAFLRRKLC